LLIFIFTDCEKEIRKIYVIHSPSRNPTSKMSQ